MRAIELHNICPVEIKNENTKIKSYPDDWSTGDRNENNRRRNTNHGKERSDESATSWKFRDNKDKLNYQSTIQVAPMTI